MHKIPIRKQIYYLNAVALLCSSPAILNCNDKLCKFIATQNRAGDFVIG